MCGCYGQKARHGLTYGDLQRHCALLQDTSFDRNRKKHQGTVQCVRSWDDSVLRKSGIVLVPTVHPSIISTADPSESRRSWIRFSLTAILSFSLNIDVSKTDSRNIV